MKRIFLVRHGESEGNVDRSAHRRIADHAISLTAEGEAQAVAAGEALARYIESNVVRGQPKLSRQIIERTGFDDSAYWSRGWSLRWEGPPVFRLWTSPYRRTRQTTEGLLSGVSNHDERVRKRILDVREHILLVEQQAGLFDGLRDEEYAEVLPRETEYYDKQVAFEGKFWAPCPMGESRFNVAQRVHQAFGTFHRDSDRHGIENIIVVCHGVTLRAFVMMWCHKPFEWFENERNPNNCAIRLLEDGVDKGYIFEGFPRHA